MARQGVFIVFEGIDGSGKSTHIKLLCHELSRQGYDVLHTSEPSQGRIGSFIREYAEHRRRRLPAEVEALLFAADRFEHTRQVVEPALERGCIVVSDRYLHSSLAYQGAEGLSLDWIRELNRFALKPDLSIFLDISPETGLGRMRRRRRTVFEDFAYQQRVRNQYLGLVDRGELVKVDAERPVHEVKEDIINLVRGLLRTLGVPPR
ncbi:MAG: dTMP kinase [Candidatus Bathyarchaeia archaeon]